MPEVPTRPTQRPAPEVPTQPARSAAPAEAPLEQPPAQVEQAAREIKRRRRRSWVIILLALMLICVSLCATNLLGLPGQAPDWLPVAMHSTLQADYRADPLHPPFAPVSLSLVEELLEENPAGPITYETIEAGLQTPLPSVTPNGTIDPPPPAPTWTAFSPNTPTATPPPSHTPLPPSPTATTPPSSTPSLTPTDGITPLPEWPTPTATLTSTPRPNHTPRPTRTGQPTDPVLTNTPPPSATPFPPSPTPKPPTSTPRPTSTPLPTHTLPPYPG